MIVGSMNIRGLGTRPKRNKIRYLVWEQKLDFIVIQETKMEDIRGPLCYSLWGNHCCSWVFAPSAGNNGGMLSIWDASISPVQSAFVKGRNLVDGVFVENEVIDFAKRNKKERLIIKVDFEKAYNSVNWSFLDYMMRRFGFND